MTESEALRLAKKIADTNNWIWLEPIMIQKRRRWFGSPKWIVRTNCNARGCNILIEIDEPSQRVLHAVFCPR